MNENAYLLGTVTNQGELYYSADGHEVEEFGSDSTTAPLVQYVWGVNAQMIMRDPHPNLPTLSRSTGRG